MNKDIKESIEILENEIADKQKFLELLKSLNFDEVLTEEEWHQICKTPLRPTKFMGDLLKNIFPEAEDIKVGANYVYFYLKGFKCLLPTADYRGIYVDTSWYTKVKEVKEFKVSPYYQHRLDYIEARRRKASWLELATIRSKFWHRKDNYNKIFLFFMWFLSWKWEKFNESLWLNDYEEAKKAHLLEIENYKKIKENNHERTLVLFNEVIPRLKEFTCKVDKVNESPHKIEDILKLENIL